jgi:hypothetical protein
MKALRKRSFPANCVPKLELGNEIPETDPIKALIAKHWKAER